MRRKLGPPHWQGGSCLALVMGFATSVLSPSVLLGEGTKATLGVSDLRAEYKENPLGIDAPKPRLSWRLVSAARGASQSAYEIRVGRTETAVRGGRNLVWTSGRVASGESTQRAYEGPGLESGLRYHWQVRVWDRAGKASPWSAPAWWEMGLLEASDWKATWIEPDLPEDVKTSGPSPGPVRVVQVSPVPTRAGRP